MSSDTDFNFVWNQFLFSPKKLSFAGLRELEPIIFEFCDVKTPIEQNAGPKPVYYREKLYCVELHVLYDGPGPEDHLLQRVPEQISVVRPNQMGWEKAQKDRGMSTKLPKEFNLS